MGVKVVSEGMKDRVGDVVYRDINWCSVTSELVVVLAIVKWGRKNRL